MSKRDQVTKIGDKLVMQMDAPSGQVTVVFEDDGDTGYFYALAPLADGQLELRDLESTNGTYVNGVRIGQPLRLVSGDRVQVGRVEMVAVRDED